MVNGKPIRFASLSLNRGVSSQQYVNLRPVSYFSTVRCISLLDMHKLIILVVVKKIRRDLSKLCNATPYIILPAQWVSRQELLRLLWPIPSLISGIVINLLVDILSVLYMHVNCICGIKICLRDCIVI